jgi:ACS family tartrate transporter-like MFS transporter
MLDPADQAVVQKTLRRLVPFCILCYFLNYIDRVNISVAQLKMIGSPGHPGVPGFTPDVYAFGVSIFFLGYCLFELPSNLIQQRVGPRRWIARIMISWGIISACFIFIRGPRSFYTLRFLLGFAEAGFFPGILLYLSHWVPHQYRARASAAFLTSTAISGLVGNPVGGFIQYFTDNSPLGLASWQWLFLLEGLPSILMGIAALIYLVDRPSGARWLSAEERARLAALLARERDAHPASHLSDLRHAFASPHTWILSAFYGLVIFAFYLVNFFTTLIIERSLKTSGLLSPSTPKHILDLYVCLAAAIPFGAATLGMVLIGRHSDRHNERKLHLAFACMLITVGMLLAAFAPRIAGGGTAAGGGGGLATCLTVAGLSIGAIGAFGIFGPFWALPPQLLAGTAAAAAFAIINSIGNFFGGFVQPIVRSRLGEQNSLLIAAGFGLLAALLILASPIPRHREIAAAEGSDSPAPDSPATPAAAAAAPPR